MQTRKRDDEKKRKGGTENRRAWEDLLLFVIESNLQAPVERSDYLVCDSQLQMKWWLDRTKTITSSHPTQRVAFLYHSNSTQQQDESEKKKWKMKERAKRKTEEKGIKKAEKEKIAKDKASEAKREKNRSREQYLFRFQNLQDFRAWGI